MTNNLTEKQIGGLTSALRRRGELKKGEKPTNEQIIALIKETEDKKKAKADRVKMDAQKFIARHGGGDGTNVTNTPVSIAAPVHPASDPVDQQPPSPRDSHPESTSIETIVELVETLIDKRMSGVMPPHDESHSPAKNSGSILGNLGMVMFPILMQLIPGIIDSVVKKKESPPVGSGTPSENGTPEFIY